MDDAVEILQLPLEAYPEYPAGLAALFRDSPWVMSAYFVCALVVILLVIRLLARGPSSFGRTFLLCLVVAVLVLPGAIGLGGISVPPLGFVVLMALISLSPWLLLYNAT